MKRYCRKCKKETNHTRIGTTGFIGQCAMAAISGFSLDLREPKLECNSCGARRD